ncbi:MAG: HIT family protein [Syntrophobacteraceae bacterium]|nr:HIT family protein [Desulfobacteraceae bacterium]
MADCIFCKIIKGEIPCARIYEDDTVLSFLDIGPINPGHALVVPKAHYATLLDAPDDILQACVAVSRKIARSIIKSVGADGLNLLQNNYRAAGQLVDHVHFHLIPRHKGDGFMTGWPAKSYPPGELDKVLGKIRENLE